MNGHFLGFVIVACVFLPHITYPLEALDDFEIPEEITTLRESKDILGPVQLKRIQGRTRQELTLPSEKNRTGRMIENYCCFWIYQGHPAIPQTWKHMAEYPFDFNFNGQFVKNQRHNEIEVPEGQDNTKYL